MPDPTPSPAIQQAPPPPVQQQQPSPLKSALKKPKDDGEHAGLAMLLANRGDGLDTFGNVGNMRECDSDLLRMMIIIPLQD